MKILLLITFVVSLLTWVQAKQNTPKINSRNSIESEGGVVLSNAQFEAASKSAMSQISAARVLSVKKRTDCIAKNGAIFEVKLKNKDSQMNIDLHDLESKMLIVSNNLKVQDYKGTNCLAQR